MVLTDYYVACIQNKGKTFNLHITIILGNKIFNFNKIQDSKMMRSFLTY